MQYISTPTNIPEGKRCLVQIVYILQLVIRIRGSLSEIRYFLCKYPLLKYKYI